VVRLSIKFGTNGFRLRQGGCAWQDTRGQTRRSARGIPAPMWPWFPVGRDGRLRPTDHGQLVADWVEVFAPVVIERFRR
jgi:hypothetical protein